MTTEYDRNPGAVIFRAAREMATRRAIKRKEIQAANPSINAAMLERMVTYHIETEDRVAEASRQKARSRKSNRKKRRAPRAVRVNQSLAKEVRQWKRAQQEDGDRFLPTKPQ